MQARQASLRGAGGTILIALAAVLLLNTCKHDGTKEKTGELTYGTVIVDSPEVYTRERLVNDRFRHEAWLLDRLEQADSVVFGPQGSFSTRDRSSSSLTAAINANLPVAAVTAPAQTEGTDPSTSQPSGQQEPSTPPNVANGSNDFAPSDQFSDWLTYLDRIRTEIIENQLDDRHDLEGNTLYRLKFDVSVIPGSNTRSWARLDICLSNSTVYERASTGIAPPRNRRIALAARRMR